MVDALRYTICVPVHYWKSPAEKAMYHSGPKMGSCSCCWHLHLKVVTYLLMWRQAAWSPLSTLCTTHCA